MKTHPVTLLQLAILTGTRAAAGGGLALFISDKGSSGQRKALGWSLVGAGSLTYLMLVLDQLARNKKTAKNNDRGMQPV